MFLMKKHRQKIFLMKKMGVANNNNPFSIHPPLSIATGSVTKDIFVGMVTVIGKMVALVHTFILYGMVCPKV